MPIWLKVMFGVAGGGALIALVLPEIGTVAAITIIGLPLAIVYWALPALFLVALIAFGISRVLPLRNGAALIAVSLAASLLLLAVPPSIINIGIDNEAAAIVAGDRSKLALPLRARAIAFRQPAARARLREADEGYSTCNQFCIHALLNGVADRFLIVNVKDPHAAIALNEPAVEYTLRKMPACPPVRYKSAVRDLDFRTPRERGAKQLDAVEELMLRVSSGTCLVSRDAVLGDADIAITDGNLKRRGKNAFGAGFDLGADTLSATRRTVHLIDGKAGSLTEIFRNTAVEYAPLGPMLLPVPHMAAELRTSMGWWRRNRRINMPSRYPGKAEWTSFLTGTLGLDLELKTPDRSSEVIARIDAIRAEGRAPNRAEWALIATHFDNLQPHKVTSEQFRAAVDILEDPAFPAPPRLYAIVEHGLRNASPDLDRIAASLVRRLADGSVGDAALQQDAGEQIETMSIAVDRLPGETLRPHLNDFLRLVRSPDVQFHGYKALRKLSAFGEPAVPAMLGLIDTGLAGGDRFYNDRQFQLPYLGGLGGLCLAGETAASALSALHLRIGAEQLPLHASYGKLLAKTLIRLGDSEENAWRAYSGTLRPDRKQFDKLVRRAKSDNPDCGF
ncbi:MAG: hypothetical protein R3D45_13335 [Rhizobiaceae bacterium]